MTNQFMPLLGTLAVSFLLLLGGACTPPEEGSTDQDKLLAKVYNKSLYLSEIQQMLPEDLTPEDSSLRVNAFVDRWVRDALLMHEAEKNIPKDLNIDELVRNYRASLILHNYEKQLVEMTLDSTVTRPQVMEYFEKTKDQFKLPSDIFRGRYIKILKQHPGKSQVNKLWKSSKEEDFFNLQEFCTLNAAGFLLNDSIWYAQDALEDLFPEGVLEKQNLRKGGTFTHSDETFRYMLYLTDHITEGQDSPLSYVEAQIKKLLLHKRKLALLDQKKDELYEIELHKKNAVIY